MRTGRRAHTVMDWVHAYNAQGLAALAFRRTGGRRPFFCPRREAELGEVVCAAQRTAATRPIEGADPAPRWTLRRLVHWARERFGLRCCRETIRGPAPPQVVVEESQEAARPGRPGAATSVHRAAPGRAGRCPTRSTSRGLCG